MNEPTCNRMPLLAPELRGRLLEHGRQSGVGPVLVVKFFNPVGIGAWLATELDADTVRLGAADDAPELGSFSLEELATLELPFGMHIDRGLFFTGVFPISAYAEAARAASPRPSTSSWTMRACWKRGARPGRVDIAEPDE